MIGHLWPFYHIAYLCYGAIPRNIAMIAGQIIIAKLIPRWKPEKETTTKNLVFEWTILYFHLGIICVYSLLRLHETGPAYVRQELSQMMGVKRTHMNTMHLPCSVVFFFSLFSFIFSSSSYFFSIFLFLPFITSRYLFQEFLCLSNILSFTKPK